jgi:hypothetical protein
MTSAQPVGQRAQPSLAVLVEDLRRRDFPVGTSEAIDAARVILALAEAEPPLDDPARLRDRLRPVFCKSRDQQQQFDSVFDAWYTVVEPAPPGQGEGTIPPAGRQPPSPKPRRTLWMLLAALAVATLSYFWWRSYRQPVGPVIAPSVAPALPQTLDESKGQSPPRPYVAPFGTMRSCAPRWRGSCWPCPWRRSWASVFPRW